MATTRRILVTCMFSTALLVGCGDDDRPPTDAGDVGDAGPGDAGSRDAGSRDAGSRDAGSSDPCAASDTNAVATVGCNGGVLGADVADDAFGGTCTPGDDTNPAGSCTDEGAFCAAVEGASTGLCLIPCEPEGSYVSTSTCPEGSRCFTFDAEVAVCYPDCTDGSDCTTAACDSEGSCVPTDAPPPTDGGVSDGGTGDGGLLPDAALPDAALPDAGLPDAG